MHTFEYELSKARHEDLLAEAAQLRLIGAVSSRRSARQVIGGTLIALGRRLEGRRVQVA